MSPGEERELTANLGWADAGQALRHGDAEGVMAMHRAAISGMNFTVDDLDIENVAVFPLLRRAFGFICSNAWRAGCRYPPTTSCPWCASGGVAVDAGGRQKCGALLRRRLHHAIQPATFKGHVPI